MKTRFALPKIMKHAFELHLGEAQAIVLARKTGMGTLLLIDESSGRAFAEAWGLKAKGVLYVIMAALRSDLLDDAEAKETVLTLVRKGSELNQTCWQDNKRNRYLQTQMQITLFTVIGGESLFLCATSQLRI